MKASLIFTVYNEQKTIKKLMDSILNQTKVPDEIVILDSLSKDDTAKIIKSYKNKRIKLIEQKADIGTARNICIKKAKNEIILVTDGGCILDKDWCKEMLKSFENSKADVVGGVFKPIAKNFFEKCQGIIVCKPIEEIDEKKFLPSSRSFGFKKSVWKDVGGYPKHEIGGEDTKFVLNVKDRGYNIIINKKAIVYWGMRSPLKNFNRQFYLYAKGDVRSGNLSKMKSVLVLTILFPVYLVALLLSLILTREVFLGLVILPFLYFLYQGIKVATQVKDIRGIYWGFVLSFFKRFMFLSGIWAELLSNHRATYRNENY
jgi:glycosyltransferase involved in cell wall biosynthesis